MALRTETVTDRPRRRPWSLAWGLPLLMTFLLAAMLAITLAITYATLTESAISAATARLNRAADELGNSATTSVGTLRGRVAAVAASPEMVRVLTDSLPDAASIAAARTRLDELLSAPADTGLTVELWTADGRLLAVAGRELRAASPTVPQRSGETLPANTIPGFGDLDNLDSAMAGGLYRVDTLSYFWTVAPVFVDSQRLGYVARRSRVTGSSVLQERLRGLTAANLGAYYRNADGSQWTAVTGAPASAPTFRDSVEGGNIVTRPGVGDLLMVTELVPGSGLGIALELPMSALLANSRMTLRRLALMSLAVLLIGTLASLVIGRRITQPLTALIDASELIAEGDYGARVRPAGADELVRLGSSFNRMADEVGNSRGELELQTEEAQATAEQLDQSNQELGSALQDLEQREAQFRALADAIPQLSWMAHADGTVFWHNERWYAYTGTTPAQMQDGGWHRVHHDETLEEVVARWRASVDTGAPFEMEIPLRGKEGAFRWFLVRVRPVHDTEGAVVRWFGTCTDIQTLRDAREAADMARVDAEAARAQAESANRAKSEFLAVMSHELRTPLNAIGGYTELLELGLRGPVTDAQRRDLDRIRTSQQHLLGLISGVLDLSRIEAGRVSYDLTATALDPFLAGLDSLVEPQAAGKSLTLTYDPCAADIAVLADREKLRQILLNLLSNAIRYTPAGGRITIGASAGETTVAITVTDNGVGIAATEIERIFEPFVQLDRSLTRVRDGVGLGLAISLDLARGMAGDLRAESRQGEGSRFILTLPRAYPNTAEFTVPRSGEYPVVREGSA